MALTKAQIVESIRSTLGFTRNRSLVCVETLLEIMKRTMASGEDVLISGFGRFRVNGKGARKGRNPATGTEMMLPSRMVVTFKCSGKLRRRINRV